ncbi:MAG: DUF2029 domain-containing protein [Acidobacteria bacterium]|nr:DUF2029 domain-containing protein [Acidobacteriota bacterium]MBV9477045.1 DUF2029 domain-containing protein [Acidobacteriota bacterium]
MVVGVRTKTALTIAAAAVLVRALVLVASMYAGHLSIAQLADARDGRSYLHYAAAARAPNGFASLPEYDRRVFPGYPALLAVLRLDAMPLLAMIVNWLAAGAVAALCFVLFDDARIGWAMAVLTPSYVMYSTVLMTEPLVLLLGVGALYFGRRERPAFAGAALGLDALVRPLALPLGLAFLAERRKSPRAIVVAVIAAVVAIAIGAACFVWWSGSLSSGVRVYASDPRAYGGSSMFTWPFASLVRTSLAPGIAKWKIAYIWLHVIAALGALVPLARNARREFPPFVWHASNMLLVLCVGGVWGFHEFHRLIVPSLPPLFWAYRRLLPSRTLAWIAIALLSAAVAAKGLSHGW